MKYINTICLVLCSSLFVSCLKKKTPEPSQLSVEISNIDKALADNKVDYIAYHNSGIRLAVKSFGKGVIPHNGQDVKYKYTGRLLSDMSVIDTGSYSGALTRVHLQGLFIGLSSLPTGSKASIYIPSLYAFGEKGNAKVPGNSTVVYEVFLESFTRSAVEQLQFNVDTAKIRQYLVSKNIQNAIMDSSGIWYTIEEEGTGEKPRVYDKITASYQGMFLLNGSTFDQGDLIDQSLFGLIDGFRVGMPLIKQGSAVTLYIPSGLGYGSSAVGNIPSNSNLIFKVKLNSFAK